MHNIYKLSHSIYKIPRHLRLPIGFLVLFLPLFFFLGTQVFSAVKVDDQAIAAQASSNPFAGATFYTEPNTNAHRQIEQWRDSRPDDAQQLEKIAYNPSAKWIGDWNTDVRGDVDDYVTTLTNGGMLPVMIAYNIPNRDCGLYSAGGASSAEDYRDWIQGFADGIGNRKAVIILEPDALGHLNCLSSSDRSTRLSLIRNAVNTFAANPNASVYIDAGGWVEPQEMANILKSVDIHKARGISTNLSNFETSATSAEYIRSVNNYLDTPAYGIIDTSRNGQGPAPGDEWCNPDGRGLGTPATSRTGNPLIDSWYWLKTPGESDGTCNGGPGAGQWWAEYALGLAKRSNFQLDESPEQPTPQPEPEETPTEPESNVEQNFETSTTTESTNVTPGSTVTFATAIQSAAAADSVNVLIEVYDTNGNSALKRSYDKVSFSRDETKNYAIDFQVPSSNPASSYRVKIGIFSSDWSTLHHWNDNATTIEVEEPAVQAEVSSTASIYPTSSITPGTKLKVTTAVKSTGTLSPVNIVVDVVDNDGNIVKNQSFSNTSLAANTTKKIVTEFAVPYSDYAEKYTVKVGVFNDDWSSLYHWNDNAKTFAITNQVSTPQTLSFSDATWFDPASVSARQTVAVTSALTSNMNTGPLNVVIDIYDSNGTKVLNQGFVNVQFTAGQTKRFATEYTMPWWPADCYTAKVGVFSPDWSKVFYWNDSASKICR